MRRALNPVVIAAAALAAGALAAGCGGEAYPTSLVTPPTSVAKPSPKPGARPLGLRAQMLAAVDGTEAAHTARLTWHADAHATDEPASSIDATGVIDFRAPALDMFVTTTDGTDSASSEVRVVNGIDYSNEAGQWESAPAAEQAGEGSDPNDELAYLRGVADDVRVAGRDTLHGIVATKYTATVDLASAATHVADAPTRARVDAALKVFEAKVPVTVWIAGGQVRKLAMTLDVLPGIAGQTGDTTVAISFEFYDFGIPVHVVAPAHAVNATDRAAQSDLRNGLTAEKTNFVDDQRYTTDRATLHMIESSLNWGGKLKVAVADAVQPGDAEIVCLSERAQSGTEYAIADVAAGPYAGTYYGHGCPSPLTPGEVATLGGHW